MENIVYVVTHKAALFQLSVISLHFVVALGCLAALLAAMLEYRVVAVRLILWICVYASFTSLVAMMTSPVGLASLAGLPIFAVFVFGAYFSMKKLAELREFRKRQITPWNI